MLLSSVGDFTLFLFFNFAPLLLVDPEMRFFFIRDFLTKNVAQMMQQAGNGK